MIILAKENINNENKISIIVPVYNVGEKLNRSVDSLINQTYKNIEILLINDGSTDNSGTLCDKYAQRDSRIKVIHKKNGGVSSARNIGISEATGKYIMFVDSDDYTDEKTCQVMINAIEKYDVDMIVASYNTVYNGKVMKHICPEKVYDSVESMKDDFRLIYLDCFLNSPWNKLFKRELIKNKFDESMRYFEDYYFVLDYMDNIKSLATIETPMYYYIEDTGSSLTKVFREDTFDVFPKIYLRQKEFCHKYIGDGFDNELKSSLLYGFYNTAQKLVYSKGSKKYKLSMINNWLNNYVIKTELDNNTLQYINAHSNKQFKIAYKYIINKEPKKLYRMLILKKVSNPVLQMVKGIVKGNIKRYNINNSNR